MSIDLAPRHYRVFGTVLAALFAVTALLFYAIPGRVVEFFNRLSEPLGLPAAPISGHGFYLVLALAYMVVVITLAWLMGRRPADRPFAYLLAMAKFSSAILSLGFFVARSAALVYLANALVDGAIAVLVLVVRPRLGAGEQSS